MAVQGTGVRAGDHVGAAVGVDQAVPAAAAVEETGPVGAGVNMERVGQRTPDQVLESSERSAGAGAVQVPGIDAIAGDEFVVAGAAAEVFESEPAAGEAGGLQLQVDLDGGGEGAQVENVGAAAAVDLALDPLAIGQDEGIVQVA